MKFNLLNRRIHYWLAIAVAVPALVIISMGILLQVRKQFAWIQPPEQKGSAKEPTITMPQVLEIVRGVPQTEVSTWADVNRVEFRPNKGMCKVWCKNDWEVQLDTKTGDILQVAFRRSDFIESIHDGSIFGDWIKLGVFLPAGVILLTLWLTGMYLFWLPIYVKRRRKSARMVPPRAEPPAIVTSVAGPPQPARK